MLEPEPTPARSEGTTVCFSERGHFGSSVSANSIFRVLAGASRQCALCAASTSPDSASATIQDRAADPSARPGRRPPRSPGAPAAPGRGPPPADILAGGVAEGAVEGDGAAPAPGAVRAVDSRTADVTNSERTAVFWGADTVGNVPAAAGAVPTRVPPRARIRTAGGDTGRVCPSWGRVPESRPAAAARRCEERSAVVKLSRPVSWFLLAFGVWSWVIWITFVKNLAKDGSGLAFEDGDPTAYFWVHLLLAVVSFVLGTVI